MYKLGFACGIAWRNTAGAAINDALANSNPNITAPPRLNPIAVATRTPTIPLKVGIIIANAVRKIPTLLISPNLWPAIIPISIIKITIAPVNISSNTILIEPNPSSPMIYPITIQPSKITMALPVIDSCKTWDNFVLVSFNPTSISDGSSFVKDCFFARICFDTAMFVKNIAMIKATGSSTARIAAKYPSDVTPWFFKNDKPTENVTAPTAP